MIKLFNPKENNFNSAGIATLMPIKLIETKKISLNGWFIDVELPMKYKDLVKQDMLAVIKSKSKLQPQAFRIKNIEYTKRKMKFQAEHVMFDARDYYLVDVRPTKINAHTALNYVNDRTDKRSPFTFSSNVNNTSTAYFLDKTLLEAMETIEERWGGFFDANNWHIELKKSIGVDRGEVISYGKNLEDIKVHEDWSNVVTRIYPVGFDGVRLPEVYIDADVQYPTPYTKRIDFETEYEDDDRTEENLIPELKKNALEYLEKNKYPRVNYEIKSDINQRMEIGDTVHVKHPLVDLVTEVQEYEYNVLTKRVVKLVFGNYTRDVKQKFDKIKEDIDRVITQTSKQEAITQHQTDLINNLNKNGHVYIDDNQILILDKLPKENAKYVWRWNMGGLAFSENGVEGPFKQAWTIDGTFNTDFISAGSIMTNHLSSDVGASLDLSSNTAINQIVNDLEGVHNSENIMPNLNGTFENYQHWSFYRLITSQHGTPNDPIFHIIENYRSLVPHTLRFFAPGKATNRFGRVVPDIEHSFRGKVLRGDVSSLKITLEQYVMRRDGVTGNITAFDKIKADTYDVKPDKDNIIQFTAKLEEETTSVALVFNIPSNINPDNPLELSEMMFTRGAPQSFKPSNSEAKQYAKAEISILDNQVKSNVKEIKRVNNKVVDNSSELKQLSNKFVLKARSNGSLVLVELGADAYKGSNFYVKADNIALEGYTSINGAVQIDEKGYLHAQKGGTIGGFEIGRHMLTAGSGNSFIRLDSNPSPTANVAIMVGSEDGSKAPFYVSKNGYTILRSGEFGGWNITGEDIISKEKGKYYSIIRGGKADGLLWSGNVDASQANIYISKGGTGYFRNLYPSGGSKMLGTSGTANRWTSVYLENQPNVASDLRVKDNVQNIPDKLLKRLSKVKPKKYIQNGQWHFGYIAQDIERELYKYCVDTYGFENAKEEMKKYAFLHKDVSYMSLLYGEIAVIKDAQREKEIKELRQEVKELKEMVYQLRKDD